MSVIRCLATIYCIEAVLIDLAVKRFTTETLSYEINI